MGQEEIGTHTLRKTFGYHFYKKTKDVAMLQDIFNYSAPVVTKRYIGISQDEIDLAIDEFSLSLEFLKRSMLYASHFCAG